MPSKLTSLIALFLAAGLAPALHAQRTQRSVGQPFTPGRLLVSGFNSNAVHVYRTRDGAPRGEIAPVPGAQSITEGPDGLLYACAEAVDEIVRIDPDTLTLVDAFVRDDPATGVDETGGLDGPTAAVFGPDGNLYVASFNTDSILRYDGSTGVFLGVFVLSGTGNLNGPDAGTKFGPDGHLYVPSFFNSRVLRYDGSTGTFLGAFIPAGTGNLRQPRDLVFHRGYLYVASSQNGRILRFRLDGTFVETFATLPTPYSLGFHPLDGNLYAVSLSTNSVRVFDWRDGSPVRTAVPSGAGGLDGAVFLYFLR